MYAFFPHMFHVVFVIDISIPRSDFFWQCWLIAEPLPSGLACQITKITRFLMSKTTISAIFKSYLSMFTRAGSFNSEPVEGFSTSTSFCHGQQSFSGWHHRFFHKWRYSWDNLLKSYQDSDDKKGYPYFRKPPHILTYNFSVPLLAVFEESIE